MGSYQGAGTSHEVRMELAQRAIAIGYTRDGAGRLMDEAYWVEGAGYGDECVKHPGCRINSQVDGCEACEVVRQSDEKGFISRTDMEATLSALVNHTHAVRTHDIHSVPGVDSDAFDWAVKSGRVDTADGFVTVLGEDGTPDSRYAAKVKPTKAVKVAVVHYAESASVKAPCGAGARMNPNPDKTTCGGCKKTRRHQKALHTHLTAQVQDMFTDAGIRTDMMIRHRTSGVLGVIREISRSGAAMGYWGPWRGITGLSGKDDYVYPTPDALMAAVEIITIDDLITVGSLVAYMGKSFHVAAVSMAGGVDLREVGSWRQGQTMSATDFAAHLSRGYLEITTLAPTGAEVDPLITLINDEKARRQADVMATFPVGGYLLVKDGGCKVIAKVTSHAGESISYTRIGAGERIRTLTWGQFAAQLDNGVAEAVTVGTEWTGDPLVIDLVKQTMSGTAAAESVEVFEITGAGVHNRHGVHRITAFYGVCCDTAQVHMHMSALATVIADRPQVQPTLYRVVQPTRYKVSVGDVITVDHEVYRVTARRYADPILVPVRFEK